MFISNLSSLSIYVSIAPVLNNHLNIVGELPSALATLYEYFYDGDLKQWVPWTKKVPKYVHSPERKFNEILVPTVDTVRATWLLELMVGIKHPVVLVGETGTSKTATTANFLRTLNTETHVRFNMSFILN